MAFSGIGDHLRRVSELYAQITPGQNLTSASKRSRPETLLLEEISSHRHSLRNDISFLQRSRPIHVATGDPKGSWAHVYYVSFHDPQNSLRPTEGFYPAFLLSVDQKMCWLTVMVAAASAQISGRGGWSQRRGTLLKERAKFLGRNLPEQKEWVMGPITLGTDGGYTHQESGNNRSAARGYECGSIIARRFNPANPPHRLEEWINTAFQLYDSIFADESIYIQMALPRISQKEIHEQANAAITGRKAEEFFIDWANKMHPEWGRVIDRTDRVGLGFDVEFPRGNMKVEIKGCRQGVESIRLTEKEWNVARKTGDQYFLALVSELDSQQPVVNLIRDPYRSLHNGASKYTTQQVTYIVPGSDLRERIKRNVK